MLLRIDFRSGKPAHLQVVDQIRTATASGTLRPGEALPSIGAVSAELRVNRNTIVKAYSELEGIGLIELQPGGGYAVKGDRERSRKETRLTPAEIAQVAVQGPILLHRLLTYALLAMLLGALYLAFATLGRVVAVAAVAVAVLPLWPLAARLARRVVFAKRFELPRVLQIIKAEAPAQPDLESFLDGVAQKTAALLGARPELIQDRAQVLALCESFPALRSARAPVSAGADFLMPVRSDVEMHGVLRLGPKTTGEAYDPEDLRFLAALGEQVALTANQFRRRHERQDFEYALDIQQGLLPREVPQVAGFTIAGSWQPAQAVGGDYYDAFQLTATETALAVADVSGKGMAAALLMANLQATVKAYATLDSSPQDVCGRVNRAICNSITPGKYITFFYAVLDAGARRLTYTNAGHNPPLLVRRDGSCLRLAAGGTVLGVFSGAAFESVAVDLRLGDRLLMFTDGITEATDPRGEEFGEERLIALLREEPAAAAAELQATTMQRVTQYCHGNFADDATVLAVVVDAPP
jgi:serine phosphatase RsbU (regulator of sigma subunit)/DNA-binding transcriptional regulator YhcF (GntR family)